MDLPVNNLGTGIALLLRVITAAIIIRYIIPLQIKEAKVVNGLAKLRRQMLISGFIFFATNLISLWFLWELAIAPKAPPIQSQILQLINAIAFLAMSWIGYQIYHQQYQEPH